MTLKRFGLGVLKIVAVLLCAFSYFLSFGLTFVLPPDMLWDRVWQGAVLLGISFVLTIGTLLLFGKKIKFLCAGAAQRK